MWLRFLSAIVAISSVKGNNFASQLYEDLMYSYNRVVRPVKNASDVLTIHFGASLIRIIDVDSKNQIFTTNLWLEMQWVDSKLSWEPDEYGGIRKLHMPADQIWLPDIVLYNNAAGDPEISIYTDALIHNDGLVVWKPPAIYRSFCAIDVMYFPYDEQQCEMKFGLWTHTGNYVDLMLLPTNEVKEGPDIQKHSGKTVYYLEKGMDLSYYYKNAEWDLLDVKNQRNEEVYGTCCGPEMYIDVTFYFHLRRKPLFYTVNLIVPCALISFLTTFVFYLPADAGGHQLTFSISILVTLTVFFLVLIELIPPTSVVIPLFGKYLLFTMILVTLSIIISVICVNFHHRSGTTHVMPRWIRTIFLEKLPPFLFMDSPKALDRQDEQQKNSECNSMGADRANSAVSRESFLLQPISFVDRENSPFISKKNESPMQYQRRVHSQIVMRVIRNVQFIANHFKQLEDEENVSNDWTYVAMVIDRIFLIIFSIANIVGTMCIILTAPTLYDQTKPMDIPPATKPLGGDTLGG